MSGTSSPQHPAPGPRGPLRHLLRLIVEVDESRRWYRRARSGLVLILMIGLFGLLGYALPAVFNRLFP